MTPGATVRARDRGPARKARDPNPAHGVPSLSPAVPLDAAMAALDGFRLVLRHNAQAIDAHLQGAIDDRDPEFLHQLRIAVRRTRSVLAEGRNVLPSAIATSARGQFKTLAALTGPVRDLDVYLIEWPTYTSSLERHVAAQLVVVENMLIERRRTAYADFADSFRSAMATEPFMAWRRWLDRPNDEPDMGDAHRPLGLVVSKRIARAQKTLLDRGRAIRPETPADVLHDLRKDAKKLRYLLECFAGLIPSDTTKKFLPRLRNLQDNLGQHQDAEIHLGELRTIGREIHAAGSTADQMLAMGQVAERLDRRRLAARAEFKTRFASYDTPAAQRALDSGLQRIRRSAGRH